MAFRSLMSRVRSIALHLHHHLKTSNKILGLVGPIDHNTTTNNHHQRLVRSAVAPSSPFNTQIPVRIHHPIGGFVPLPRAHKQQHIILFARFAVNVKNETENAHLQFVRVVRAQWQAVDGMKYEIILEAIDGEDGQKKFFSATVHHQSWSTIVQLLKWEPVEAYPK